MDNHVIYTIGYGNRTIDEFIALLEKYRIEYLIDIRSKPYSKYNPAFTKAALQETLKERGVKYVFMGESLGGRPDDITCYTDGKVDYDKLSQTAAYREGIGRLKVAWEKKLTVALMCSERKPEECHRSKLIGETLQRNTIEVAHIDEDGNLKTQLQVLD